MLATDRKEKLASLHEKNQATVTWIPGHGGNEQNKAADRPTR